MKRSRWAYWPLVVVLLVLAEAWGFLGYTAWQVYQELYSNNSAVTVQPGTAEVRDTLSQ